MIQQEQLFKVLTLYFETLSHDTNKRYYCDSPSLSEKLSNDIFPVNSLFRIGEYSTVQILPGTLLDKLLQLVYVGSVVVLYHYVYMEVLS